MKVIISSSAWIFLLMSALVAAAANGDTPALRGAHPLKSAEEPNAEQDESFWQRELNYGHGNSYYYHHRYSSSSGSRYSSSGSRRYSSSSSSRRRHGSNKKYSTSYSRRHNNYSRKYNKKHWRNNFQNDNNDGKYGPGVMVKNGRAYYKKAGASGYGTIASGSGSGSGSDSGSRRMQQQEGAN